MPRLLSGNGLNPAAHFGGRRIFSHSLNNNNHNTMKREFLFPLIVGLIAGALVMVFWQFNARLDNVNAAMVQLEQASAQNTKTVGDIVNFINGQVQKNNPSATGGSNTPTTPTGK